MIPARLHRALGIADLFQHTAVVLQVLGKLVLLLGHLGHQHAQLVAHIADGLVARGLAPLAQLGGDAGALAARGLVGADGVVLRLDQLVQALRQLRLLHAPQRGHGEAVLGGALGAGVRVRAAIFLVGAD